MTRIKTMGLCLVAVFAVSMLVVATSASAATPEFKICEKVKAKGSGKFTSKTCSTAGAGDYERAEESKAKKHAYKAKNSGTPHNNLVDPFGKNKGGKSEEGQVLGTTTCTKESVKGEVTGPKTEKWKTEFQHCESQKTACNTAGDKAGVIKTQELEATLVYLDKAHKKIGLKVKGLGAGGLLAQYECLNKGLNVEVYGEILAEMTGNTNSANKKTAAIAVEGTLHLQKFMYVEEAANEETGKAVLEWVGELHACLKGEEGFPSGLTQAQCEGIIGSIPGPPPTVLVSKLSGAENVELPGIQNGTSDASGEAFLVEAS